ncbi:kinase-like protein [Xylaria telfairii]|nr:kinase-like protein [Xylaria telfairii]
MPVAQNSKPEHGTGAFANDSTAQRPVSHIRKGENASKCSFLTMPSINVEDDIASSSYLSDGHPHVESLGSRRNSTSSLSAYSASDCDAQPEFFSKAHVQDLSEGRPDISELESDLVNDEEPRSDLRGAKIGISDPANIVAIRGQCFSVHNIGKVGVQTYASGTPSLSSSIGESLQDRLLTERHHYPQGNKGYFIPFGCLESLIQLQSVEEELIKCLPYTDSHEIKDFAKKICALPTTEEKSYRKIFAILVLIEKADSILEFLREGVHDGDLPLMKLELGNKTVEFGRKPSEGKDPHPLKCFKNFSRMNLMNFEDCQWAMLAPIFGRPSQEDVEHHDLEDLIVLPFTEGEEVSEGGFGRISRVKIHPDHHNFDDSGTSCSQFAIKRLKSNDEKAFWGEFEMLSKFSGDAHPHLISLLAAYTHLQFSYLIFPWARADLADFWRVIKPKPNIKQTVGWVADQCAGLADGLLRIHRYTSFHGSRKGVAKFRIPVGASLYGRHGDIKPANILWFPNLMDDNDGGTLKLTDFGLAELHSFDSRSYITKSHIATSPTYRPPEYDMKEGKISRSYDIWTMGCLYLEFITWLLGGWDLVKLFTVKRTTRVVPLCLEACDNSFFELVEGGKTARIKKTVTEFIKVKLHGHIACTEYLHEFLDLIEEEMLLIETGEVNSNKRIECGHLNSRLQSMRKKCQDNPGYALIPATRSG